MDETRKERKIRTVCPSCGHASLFIDEFGNLVCGAVECKNPTAIGDPYYKLRMASKALRKIDPSIADQIICIFNCYTKRQHEIFDEMVEWLKEPPKKKVAKWAYPVIGMPGVIRIEFTDEMTKEEAEEKYGEFLQMVPGTEREVEL